MLMAKGHSAQYTDDIVTVNVLTESWTSSSNENLSKLAWVGVDPAGRRGELR